jgi:hypothetical protein
MSNINKKWDMNIMIQLKKIGEKSAGYRWMHDLEKQHYTQMNKVYDYIEIIILAVLTTITSGDVVLLFNTNNYRIFLSISEISLLLIYWITRGIHNSNEYNSKIISHRNSSLRFNELYMNINNEISISDKNKIKENDFLKEKTKEYTNILDTSPEIRNYTIRKYIDATANEDIHKPTITGSIDKIDISNKDTNNNDVNISINENKNTNIDKRLNMELERWIDRV